VRRYVALEPYSTLYLPIMSITRRNLRTYCIRAVFNFVPTYSVHNSEKLADVLHSGRIQLCTYLLCPLLGETCGRNAFGPYSTMYLPIMSITRRNLQTYCIRAVINYVPTYYVHYSEKLADVLHSSRNQLCTYLLCPLLGETCGRTAFEP